MYRLPDQDLFYPAVLFEYAQELEDPEDEAYYAWIETNDAFRYFMVLSGYCSDGDIYDVYTTETGAQILDRFAAGQYAFMLLGDEYACEAAAVSLDVSSMSETASSGSSCIPSALLMAATIAIFEQMASLPPFKITAFPVLKQSAKASAVTFGLAS